MQRDVKGVAVISLLFGVFAVIANGSALGAFVLCLFAAVAICLFYEQ
jgi:hypothetical protein